MTVTPSEQPTLELPAWVDDAMLAEFIDAQRYGLAEVEALLLADAAASEASRGRLARILHTLKGESGTVGFLAFEEIYHALEDHLAGKADLRPALDDVFATKDWLLDACGSIAAGRPLPDGRGYLLDRLRGRGASEPPPEAPDSDAEATALFAEFYDEAIDSLAQADDLLLRIVGGEPNSAAIATLHRMFHMLQTQARLLDLGAIGNVTQAIAEAIEADHDTLTTQRVDALSDATATVRQMLQAMKGLFAGHPLAGPVDPTAVLAALKADEPAAVGVQVPTGAENRPPEEDVKAVGVARVEATRETIKVDLGRVDDLVETIGELVIIEAMVADQPELATLSARVRDRLALLAKIVRDLQRQGLALRMVPLRGVFQKMSRLVRDLAQRLGKPVRLELAGQDAEMDRSLAESLGDPLVHMMRNAIDHGIESVAERRAAGKPDLATIHLRARHEGGNIVIEIADDGRGLNRAAILARAITRGLVHADATPSDREVHELIFHPGFSTAAQVTEMSGRGVGMDVVKKTVEGLRGRIQIATEPGRGTTFRLVLPLTLAIIDGMLLVSGGRRYVLPTLSIVESVQPTPGQIHRFGSRHAVIDLRGVQLPLVDLGALLGAPSAVSEEPTGGFVIVVDGLAARFGLLVDDLIGQQQVVIKTIDPGINAAGLFSGAAILSDGHVGLILDPTALGNPAPQEPR